MDVFFQQLVTGISIGSIYALLAVGYALIFSIFKFSNFAFGVVMMIGTFGAVYAINLGHVSLFVSIIIAMIMAALASVLIENIAYKPMRKKNAARLYLMIAGIGINFFIENLAINTIGGSIKPFPSEWVKEVVHIGTVSVPRADILAAVLSIVMLVVLWVFIYKSKTGLQIRATSYDTNTAGLMGVKVDKVSFIIFAISGLAAGLAGVFYGMKYTVYPSMGMVSMKAFIAAVIGGLGSLPGAVAGGLFLGILETIISAYVSSRLRDLFSFGVLILVLVFLPNGFFGKSTTEKI